MQLAPESRKIGVALHAYTNGVMCDGCPAYNGGKCESLRKMQRPARPEVSSPAGETVRQEAARRNLSISEVRRQRRGP